MSPRRKDLDTEAWKRQRDRVIARDGMCVDCRSTEALTADHIEPLKARRERLEQETAREWTQAEVSRTYTDDELVTRCNTCNGRKSDREAVRLDYRAPGWF